MHRLLFLWLVLGIVSCFEGICQYHPNDPSGFACSPSPTYRVNAQRNGRFSNMASPVRPNLYKANLHLKKDYEMISYSPPIFTNEETMALSPFVYCILDKCMDVLHGSGDTNWTLLLGEERYSY